MKRILALVVLNLFTFFSSFAQFSSDDLMSSNKTPTYGEAVEFYKDLSETNNDIKLYQMGDSDYGLPIYLCVLNVSQADSTDVFESARLNTTVLVNNAIHPGEPCGVNASMALALNFSQMKAKEKKEFPIVAIIPAYNIGGIMNRGAYSRANQEGPEEHGFRGNASNLDLNRDFVKMDSKNMFTFATLFHALDPDVFIDTHTSNGADYQYTLTYITPIMEKLAPSIRNLFQDEFIPALENKISENWGYDLFPYVNLMGRTPEDGMVKFNATPRYSMGYTDLFHCVSFTTETHMLKPFNERVKSTYAFLIETALFAKSNSLNIEQARKEARSYDRTRKSLLANFKLDTIPEQIEFKGYNWKNVPSEITTGDRLLYMQNEPIDLSIPYYLGYSAMDTLSIPDYYVVERQEVDVIKRLQANGVEVRSLKNDTTLRLESFKVIDYETYNRPYEGHYLHSVTRYELVQTERLLKEGDVIISTDQEKVRFIVKALSPEYVDSYFNWNFFDSYLQQKEHFSSYVFEDIAVRLLMENKELKDRLDEKIEQEESFAKSRYQQLLFIYRNSPHYENHGILPVYRSVK